MGIISEKGDTLLLQVKLKPRSSRRGIEGVEEDRLVVAVNAPAVGGKANRALIELLADETSCPKSSFRLIKGETSRLKTILVTGISRAEIETRLGILESSD